jgi:hypothetical protein
MLFKGCESACGVCKQRNANVKSGYGGYVISTVYMGRQHFDKGRREVGGRDYQVKFCD